MGRDGRGAPFQSPPVSRLALGEGDGPASLPPVAARRACVPGDLFRDRVLSDRIGFSYATWDPEDAAADFVARLSRSATRRPRPSSSCRSSWTARTRGKRTPTTGSRSSSRSRPPSPRAATSAVVTPSQAAAEVPPRRSRARRGLLGERHARDVDRLARKNRAWSLLATAREKLGGLVAAAPVVPPSEVLAGRADAATSAKAALFAAEASDWFWWFGDDHTSAHDAVFDELFRRHLAAAYRAAAHPVPRRASRARWTPRTRPPSSRPPSRSGPPSTAKGRRRTGRAPAAWPCVPAGTMHRGAGLVKEMLFGASASGESAVPALRAGARPGAAALSPA